MQRFNPEVRMTSSYEAGDGTIEFYGRINSLLDESSVVVDVGAGRGGWSTEDRSPYRRELRDLKPKVAEYIGLDVDPVVLSNPTTTRNAVITDGVLPIDDATADVVIADWVFEHIADPQEFASEIVRILKPGGYLCARTPHRYSYPSLAARAVPNAKHHRLLERIQPQRRSEDVFPTVYAMNTPADVRKAFPGLVDHTYTYTAPPSYYFGSKAIYSTASYLHRVLPRPLTACLFVFMQKPS